MSRRPLALTDQQLDIVKSAAAHVAPGDRGAFLRAIAAALAGREIGDGSVHSAVLMALGDVRRWTTR